MAYSSERSESRSTSHLAIDIEVVFLVCYDCNIYWGEPKLIFWIFTEILKESGRIQSMINDSILERACFEQFRRGASIM